MTPYMSFTAHYLTKEWALKSRCLETVFVPQNHTADNLANALRDVLADWSLDSDKLSCITTDNGANIVAAVRQTEMAVAQLLWAQFALGKVDRKWKQEWLKAKRHRPVYHPRHLVQAGLWKTAGTGPRMS